MKVIKWDSKPITKPGVYSGIPLNRYHSGDICDGKSVSSTDLRKAWGISLAHFFDQWPGNPDSERKPPTPAMILGSAAHHLILGEERFWSVYVQRPLVYRDLKTGEEKPWNANARACKDWVAKKEAAGRVIVTAAQLDTIIGMAKSLQREPLVQDRCLSGYVETSMFARDKETGLWIKVRPDVIPLTSGDYVDFKTAGEIITVALQRTIRSHGYHMQGALIWEVCEQLGLPFETFLLMFAETERPYCVYPAPLDDGDLARGRMQCRAMLRRIAHGIETGDWPGPFDGNLRPLPISNDERERIDFRLKEEGVA